MKKILVVLSLFLLIATTVFAKQPKFKEATMIPQAAAPGDSVTLTVEFTGKIKEISKVFLTVREHPYDAPQFILQPDKSQKKKNIWMLKTIVPWDAPSESVNLDITAIDKKGKEIVSKGLENQATGKAGSVSFEIQ
ncbi:MAG TPA: hypothetical protein PLP19_20790 [bacterium]|nr:hypothetical protein [bacterium]HPN45933.1 hypothetical protein [bacterium]